MKSYYAYIRVSTQKQGLAGSSLLEQRDAISRYAERHGLIIVEWFEERETAAKRGRRAFTRMVAALEKGKAHGVILHKIDRGARNLWDWARIQDLIDRGVEVHFAHDALDLNTRGGRLSADIQAVVAADYIRNLRDEVRKGINGRLKQGLYPFRAPIGYLDEGRARPKEPDPIKGPLVRAAFELYASGTYTFETLGNELYCLGLRNHAGGRVSNTGLTTILNNPFYIGIIHIRRTGQTFEGVHRPLISSDLFDRVQGLLRGKTHAKSVRHRYLFRRLVRCRHCGYSLIGERQKGHIYYRCHTRDCPTTSIREEAVDEHVRRSLSFVRFSDEEVTALDEQIVRLRASWENRKSEFIGATRLALARLEERISRLTDAYLDGAIDRETFELHRDALLRDRLAAKEKIVDLEYGKQLVPDQVAAFLELAQSALLSYETALPEEKRQILQSVTSNLVADGKELAVALRSPFDEVTNRRIRDDGAPSRDTPRTFDARSVLDVLVAHFETAAETGEWRQAA